ncbi:hypothetical protein CABS03_11903 [Colletotrichum abscissum]|uniref:Transmembrane protein n=1 Tax=Colletotrichum abscissum TaxID=1671311 RepID=A0A9P9XNR2_9PEZI|nr:hypothetical protein CABS02_02422 [Colletotrichum abscissum]
MSHGVYGVGTVPSLASLPPPLASSRVLSWWCFCWCWLLLFLSLSLLDGAGLRLACCAAPFHPRFFSRSRLVSSLLLPPVSVSIHPSIQYYPIHLTPPVALLRWPVVPSARFLSLPSLSLLTLARLFCPLSRACPPSIFLIPRSCPCRLFSSENGTSVDCFAFAVNSLSRHLEPKAVRQGPEAFLSPRILPAASQPTPQASQGR